MIDRPIRRAGELLLLVACALSTPGRGGSLGPRIDKVLGAPRYRHAHWGLLITDLKTGAVVYERNAGQFLAPASTTKLYTCAAALNDLGAGFVWKTPLVQRGRQQGETLEGDLILVASGDPNLGGRQAARDRLEFTDVDHIYADGHNHATLVKADPLAGLDNLARQVTARGIRRVQGDVLIDDRLFAPAHGSGSGPTLLTPIVVNDNLLDVVVQPGGAPGEPANVQVRPEAWFLRVDAEVETAATGESPTIAVTGSERSGVIVRGRIPAGHPPVVQVLEVREPVAFARALLIERLRRQGIETRCSPLEGPPPGALPARATVEALPRVALLTSVPLAEEIRLILKTSHNLHASLLPLAIAAHHGQRTLEQGMHLERARLAQLGVDLDAISFGGGAGGARADYVTPLATVELLRAMAGGPNAAVFEAGLPVLGVDGTLRQAVGRHSPLRGQVRAKSGTLFWTDVTGGGFMLTSKALAGYMTTAGGRRLAIVLMVNNVHIAHENDIIAVGRTLGRLCEVVWESDRSPPVPLKRGPAGMPGRGRGNR